MRFTSACMLVAFSLSTVPLLCAEEVTIKVTAYEMIIDNEMYQKVSKSSELLLAPELEAKFGKDASSVSETQAIELGKEFEMRGERTKDGRIIVSGIVRSIGEDQYAASLKVSAELITPNGRSVTSSDSDAFFSKRSSSFFRSSLRGSLGEDGKLFDVIVRLVKIEVVE